MEKEAVSEATIFQRAAHNTATARLFLLLLHSTYIISMIKKEEVRP